MANRCFKILSAVCLLLLYLWVAVAGNVALIFCDCHSHHHSVHHHLAITAEHHCSCGECHHDIFGCESIEQKCGCNHDHSAEVELYTFSRGDNDEDAERYMLRPLLAVAVESEAEAASECYDVEYGEYLLPPLSAVAQGCAALRAPPALV